MCGACRVTVGDKVYFTCVDGPEFDGHQVDYDEAIRRQSMYKTLESRKLKQEKERAEGHICRIGF
jgi:ferredoxin--NADP+ reductase